MKSSLSPLLEVPYAQSGWVIGVDEVGAGCLAGPLVTAAFAYHLNDPWVNEPMPVRIFDSKKLSEKDKTEAEKFLKELPMAFYQVHYVSVKEIDEINIYQARMKGLFEAVLGVYEQLKKELMGQHLKVYVDGPVVPRYFHDSTFDVEALPKADSKVFPVAAASILAKMERDRFMQELASSYPHYAWDSNVGYPTSKHKQAIQSFGLTEWHRRSFKCD